MATARSLQRLLTHAGQQTVGITRNPATTADVERAGASALLLDLESTDAATLAGHLGGVDAVVFAAGGPTVARAASSRWIGTLRSCWPTQRGGRYPPGGDDFGDARRL